LNIFTLPVERCNASVLHLWLVSVKVKALTAPSSFVSRVQLGRLCLILCYRYVMSARAQKARDSPPASIKTARPPPPFFSSHSCHLQIRNGALFHTTLLHPACNGAFLNGGLSTYKCELTFATFGEDRLHTYHSFLHSITWQPRRRPPFLFRGRWPLFFVSSTSHLILLLDANSFISHDIGFRSYRYWQFGGG